MFLNSIYMYVISKSQKLLQKSQTENLTFSEIAIGEISRLTRTTPFPLGILWSYKNHYSSVFTLISSYVIYEIEHYIRPIGNNAINCREYTVTEVHAGSRKFCQRGSNSDNVFFFLF